MKRKRLNPRRSRVRCVAYRPQRDGAPPNHLVNCDRPEFTLCMVKIGMDEKAGGSFQFNGEPATCRACLNKLDARRGTNPARVIRQITGDC